MGIKNGMLECDKYLFWKETEKQPEFFDSDIGICVISLLVMSK
jgi:hypothetical protein